MYEKKSVASVSRGFFLANLQLLDGSRVISIRWLAY